VSALGGCAGLIGIEGTRELTIEQLDVTPGALAPPFDPAVTSYTLDVPYGTAGLQIVAVSSSTQAAMTIDGAPLTGHVPLEVAFGPATPLTLVATSTSGVSITYTIDVSVAQFGINCASAMASRNGMTNRITAEGPRRRRRERSRRQQPRLSAHRAQDDGTGTFTSTVIQNGGDAIALGRGMTMPTWTSWWAAVRSVALGDGAGAFGTFANAINASISVYSIAIADFTGGQHPDIRRVGRGANRSVMAPVRSAMARSSGRVSAGGRLADLDGTGGLDLAAVDMSAGVVRALESGHRRSSTARSRSAASGPCLPRSRG
jgi:hypothetical protein